jgi:hypothetical protein
LFKPFKCGYDEAKKYKKNIISNMGLPLEE